MCVCVCDRHTVPTQTSLQIRAHCQINTHPSKPLIFDFQDLVRHCAVIIGGGDVDLDAGQQFHGIICFNHCLTAATLDVGQPGSVRTMKSSNQINQSGICVDKSIYILSASHNAMLI